MNFLLTYRTTPHSTTGSTPATLFLNRHVRTRLDLLHPSVSQHVESAQAKQKQQHDIHSRDRSFIVGQRILARNFVMVLNGFQELWLLKMGRCLFSLK